MLSDSLLRPRTSLKAPYILLGLATDPSCSWPVIFSSLNSLYILHLTFGPYFWLHFACGHLHKNSLSTLASKAPSHPPTPAQIALGGFCQPCPVEEQDLDTSDDLCPPPAVPKTGIPLAVPAVGPCQEHGAGWQGWMLTYKRPLTAKAIDSPSSGLLLF